MLLGTALGEVFVDTGKSVGEFLEVKPPEKGTQHLHHLFRFPDPTVP